MEPNDPVHQMYEGACDLLQAARAIEDAAGRGGVIEAVPATLGTIEEALQVLSASCYRLAGDCAPDVAPAGVEDQVADDRVLSRENEAHLMATLHDVASSIARAARVCRAGRETAAPLIARKLAAARRLDGADDRRALRLRPPRRRRLAPEQNAV